MNFGTVFQRRQYGPVVLSPKADAARRVERNVLPLVEAGAVRVPVAETFPLDEVEAAYDRFAAGGKLGKVVLVLR